MISQTDYAKSCSFDFKSEIHIKETWETLIFFLFSLITPYELNLASVHLLVILPLMVLFKSLLTDLKDYSSYCVHGLNRSN